MIAICLLVAVSACASAENRYELGMVDKFQDLQTGQLIASRVSLEQAFYNFLYNNELIWKYLTREDRRTLLEKAESTINSGMGFRIRIKKMEKLRNVEIQVLPFNYPQVQFLIIATNLNWNNQKLVTVKMDDGIHQVYRLDGEHLVMATFFAEPVAYLQKVDEEIAKDPKNVELRLAKAQIYDLYDQQAAIQEYLGIIRDFPESSIAYNNLAMIYTGYSNMNMLDPKKALTYALKACEITKYQEVGHVDTLARAYYINGDYQKALKLTKENIQKSDDLDLRTFLEILECHPPKQ
jgi:tetratricopeptide (TPR) repeat protein